MKRYLTLLAVVIVLVGAAIYLNRGKLEALSAPADMKPESADPAPTLQLPDLNEKSVAIGGKRDKLLMVNFWASWCYPCELGAPDLQALANKYKGLLDIYGINATSYDKEREARDFVDQQKLKFPILMDRDGKGTQLYKVTNFPTSLIVDSQGIVRERIAGVISKDKWEAMIDKWLKFDEEQKAQQQTAS